MVDRAAGQDRGALRVRADLDRFEKDLTATTENTLSTRIETQLLGRRDAHRHLRGLETAERETQALQDRTRGYVFAAHRVESVTDLASRARVDLETGVGKVNAIEREFENLSRVVTSLNSRTAHLRNEISLLAHKRAETESGLEKGREELDRTQNSLTETSERRNMIGRSRRPRCEFRDIESAPPRRGRLGIPVVRRSSRLRSVAIALITPWSPCAKVALDLHARIESLTVLTAAAKRHAFAERSGAPDVDRKIGPVTVLALEE